MKTNITVISIFFNPIIDFLASFSRKKGDKISKNVVLFLLFGFTGIPLITSGEIKKGAIVLLSLVVGAGSVFFVDIMILRKILCLIWMINYLSAFWGLLRDSGKKRGFRLLIIVLSFVPLELAVVYLFQLTG